MAALPAAREDWPAAQLCGIVHANIEPDVSAIAAPASVLISISVSVSTTIRPVPWCSSLGMLYTLQAVCRYIQSLAMLPERAADNYMRSHNLTQPL